MVASGTLADPSVGDTSLEALCESLVRGRLFWPDEMDSFKQKWIQEDPEHGKDGEAFIDWLVRQRALTGYQAHLLRRGKIEHFFLGTYKLLERIGEGDVARVVRAVHRLGEMVAIKVLPPSKARNPEIFARFQREAQLALTLRHPHVVRTLEVGKDRGLNFLVMEYLDGIPLGEILHHHGGPLAPVETIPLMLQALDGLHYLQERGVVHRNLTPANLMLVSGDPGQPSCLERATVKILDIGLGRALFEETGTEETSSQPEKEPVVGNPDYLAPEQAKDAQAVDSRADLYSLGCVLYHCLAGRPPFFGGSPMQKAIRHATEKPAPLSRFNPEVTEDLQKVVDRMLAKTPEERYQTPDEAYQALAVLLPAFRRAQMHHRAWRLLHWLGKDQGGPPPLPGQEMQAQALPAITIGAVEMPPGMIPVALPTRPQEETPEEEARGIGSRDLVAFALGVLATLIVLALGIGLAQWWQ
jgi:serine/threonine protein kinase